MDKVRDKVRYKGGNSRIQILRTEDPEIIPGNILSQGRRSLNHTRQDTVLYQRFMMLVYVKSRCVVLSNFELS